MNKRNTVIKGLAWKTIEQYSVLGIQFVLQIVLARMLSPKDYGLISIVTIFINISNIFIQKGFAIALVQKKEVDETDLSSVFYCTFCVAGILYLSIFFAAPGIAGFFQIPELILLLRYMAMVLFIGAINSIQNSILQRRMKFQLAFKASFIAVIMSGASGIICAVKGLGVWALVVQQFTYNIFVMIILFSGIKWYPKLKFSMSKLSSLMSFGWKVLASNLADEIFNEIRSLVIGKKYTSESLAFYTRGKQFPQLLMKSINGSIQTVVLPVLSKEQDEFNTLKAIAKRAIITSAFFVFPILAGMAATAPTLVSVILTPKWMPCVIFIQLHCIYYATWPIVTLNMQVLYALGKSDIILKTELIRKILDLVVLMCTLNFGVTAIAWGAASVSILAMFIYLLPMQIILGYPIIQQLKEVIPALILSVIMGISVYLVGFWGNADIKTFIIQIIAGILIYGGLAYLLRFEAMMYILNIVKAELIKRSN